MKYVLVTPIRNEEQFLERTIRGVLAQTILPTQWLLVDDGSTDRSGEIVDQYAAEHEWITALHRSDRGFRADGGGVHAFYDGIEAITALDWQFLINLDADITLKPDYFERCFEEFTKDSELGIGGGVVQNRVEGRLVVEHLPLFHVRGATKIYRKECWEAIGGLYQRNGWDTLDEVKANMLGWRTRSFPHIHLIQERLTGDGLGQWRNWVKNGRACHVIGYHPLFLLARSMKQLWTWPPGAAAMGLLWGYIGAALTGKPRIDDSTLRTYLRTQQLRRMVGRDSIWH